MSKEFSIGEKVRLITRPPYFKTAEPMPMLRPPDLVPVGAEGVIIDRRPGGYWAVRFDRGAFLMDSQYIDPATANETIELDSEVSEPELSE